MLKTREDNPNFYKLWDLKTNWNTLEVHAKTTRDLEITVWNGKYPLDVNTSTQICKSNTKVRVWMISRFGDVGITSNLNNPIGYDIRGIDPDIDLTDFEINSITT